jgi:hypothetical protein
MWRALGFVIEKFSLLCIVGLIISLLVGIIIRPYVSENFSLFHSTGLTDFLMHIPFLTAISSLGGLFFKHLRSMSWTEGRTTTTVNPGMIELVGLALWLGPVILFFINLVSLFQN